MRDLCGTDGVGNEPEGTRRHTDYTGPRDLAVKIIGSIPMSDRYDVAVVGRLEEAGLHIALQDDEEAIRVDERERVALLIEEHGETLASFTSDSVNLLKLLAYMLRLGGHS